MKIVSVLIFILKLILYIYRGGICYLDLCTNKILTLDILNIKILIIIVKYFSFKF